MIAKVSRHYAKLAAAPLQTRPRYTERAPGPLANYTLSTVCPACESKTFKLACKVRCAKCGFMWDCSEL
jgi:hypothetical protein